MRERASERMAESRARIKDARRAPLWSRMKREGSGPRRKCGMVRLGPRIEVTKLRRRPAAHAVVDIRGHTHVFSRARSLFPSPRLFSSSLLRFFLFLSLSPLSRSADVKEKRLVLRYLDNVRSETGEQRICISRPARLHSCSTCARAEVGSRLLTHSLTGSPVQFVLLIPQERRGNPTRRDYICTCAVSRVSHRL